ncbi:3-hydroxyacyl-CoA dehydrogenase family protein [Cohnella silvisoli]|uniref:3-hydroxyacyl-CoA dehydrogenase NAD-binding domain-containing protein n=1 Tax=Cohnella silvisoli TaxID=2873699 RepID=A0ABV1KWT3_9BACL|nr:3-hydroxyacyl-CoA dehydrogenase NAD-binding domain-containing protein [Cohnella silvisoli]MCD9023836.1 3-hydroxyacyl-CoA dehydrogenase family protein [Cohnella silvisoli]
MIQDIAVIGAGTLGHGIAETFARYGYPVNLYDSDEIRLTSALDEIRDELELLAEENVIGYEEITPAIDRIHLFTDLKQTVQDRDYVIEAIPDILELKQQLFQQLDHDCLPHTIFASNTSSLKLAELMQLVSDERKERMIINHWFNPGHLMPIVELSYFGNMPEPIYSEVEELYKSIDKQTVKVRRDVPGLIANRIQQAIAREVFSIIELGIASPEDVDKALKFGPAFRYATTGQLEIADLGGLDLWCTVGDRLLKDMDHSRSSNKLLRKKVDEGKLGVKSGEGFYKYDNEDIAAAKRRLAQKLIQQLKTSNHYI